MRSTRLALRPVQAAETEGLNKAQEAAFKAIVMGANTFLTGPPGTGKSHVLMRAVSALRARKFDVAVTALTGAAALLVGGRTIHSALGLGLGKECSKTILSRMRKRGMPALGKIRALDVLVIDEVSMLSRHLLELADAVMRRARARDEPFGGAQVVLVGDFCQLPPVEGAFAFSSPVWQALCLYNAQLTEIVRQRGDVTLQRVLASVRFGPPTDADMKALGGCVGRRFDGPVQPTRLYPRRGQVDSINRRALQALVDEGAEERTYRRVASGTASEIYADKQGIPEETRLAVGAQVVVTRNIDQSRGLVNGTRGVIRRLGCLSADVELVNGTLRSVSMAEARPEDRSGRSDVLVTYMPLQLAYAMTMHKAQGMTLDLVEMDLGTSVFAEGQAYTALSRARTLAGLSIAEISPSAFRTSKDVIDFYHSIASQVERV